MNFQRWGLMDVPGSSPRGSRSCFSSDFSLSVSSANLLTNLLNKCLGSASFLCSTSTWMQIHFNIILPGVGGAWPWWGEARNPPAIPLLVVYPPGNCRCRSPSFHLLRADRCLLESWSSCKLGGETFPLGNHFQTSTFLRLQPGNHPSRFIPSSSSWHHFYFKQLFSLPVTCPILNYGEASPLEASPYLELSSFVKVFAATAGRRSRVEHLKASPAGAAMEGTELSSHTARQQHRAIPGGEMVKPW